MGENLAKISGAGPTTRPIQTNNNAQTTRVDVTSAIFASPARRFYFGRGGHAPQFLNEIPPSLLINGLHAMHIMYVVPCFLCVYVVRNVMCPTSRIMLGVAYCCCCNYFGHDTRNGGQRKETYTTHRWALMKIGILNVDE